MVNDCSWQTEWPLHFTNKINGAGKKELLHLFVVASRRGTGVAAALILAREADASAKPRSHVRKLVSHPKFLTLWEDNDTVQDQRQSGPSTNFS